MLDIAERLAMAARRRPPIIRLAARMRDVPFCWPSRQRPSTGSSPQHARDLQLIGAEVIGRRGHDLGTPHAFVRWAMESVGSPL
jgi:hypothetical protein